MGILTRGGGKKKKKLGKGIQRRDAKRRIVQARISSNNLQISNTLWGYMDRVVGRNAWSTTSTHWAQKLGAWALHRIDRIFFLKWFRHGCSSKFYSSSPSGIPSRPAPVPSLLSGSCLNALPLDDTAGFLRDRPLWPTCCDGEAREGSLPLARRTGTDGSWYGFKVTIPGIGWEGWESNNCEWALRKQPVLLTLFLLTWSNSLVKIATRTTTLSKLAPIILSNISDHPATSHTDLFKLAIG